MSAPLRLAVVGAGWAGLAAAVQAQQAGHVVTLLEMAHQPGGRARSHPVSGIDNGQHILIGAYRASLQLMRTVGVRTDDVLLRLPLALRWADGSGPQLQPGPAAWAFTRAVLRAPGWSARDRLALLTCCARWALGGFRCQPDRSVAELCAGLPPAVRERLIDPLCVASLNTPAAEASASVFLRVLRDGLFGGRGACDLLLPRRPLSQLLPQAGVQWLQARGASVWLGHRVQSITPRPGGWQVDGQDFDAVVLASSATEAARLMKPLASMWAARCEALRFEPIVSVQLEARGTRLPLPMLALREGVDHPAQFVFDHGSLGGPAGRLVFVISGAAPWVARGHDAIVAAVISQAQQELATHGFDAAQVQVLSCQSERRATFRCTPGLHRPSAVVAPGLVAAGDYVEGPYPATLEGAVRSGIAAVGLLPSTMQNRVSPKPLAP